MDDKDVQQRIALYLEASEKIKQDGELDSEKHAKNLATQKKLFQQVVTELGLSAEEQSELEQMGEKFLNIAQDFFFKSDFAQAKVFAEKAVQLMPYDVRPRELLMTLAAREQSDAGEEMAKQQAAEILKLQPSNKNALLVINRKKPTDGGSKWLIGASAVLIPLFLGGAGAFVFSLMEDKPEPSPEIVVQEQPSTPTVSTVTPAKAVKKEPSPVTGNALVIDGQIPIEVHKLLDGIVLEDRGSEFSFYKTSYSYQLKLVLKNQSTEELGGMKVLMELLDEKGELISKKAAAIRDDYEPMIRPGETESFSLLLYEEILDAAQYREPKSVRLTMGTLDHTPAPETISKETVKLEWKGGKPKQFNLKVQRRTSTENYGTYNSILKGYHSKNIYEITNTGTGVIKSLKLREDRLDKNGNVLDSDESLVTYSSEVYIAPNETRLDLFFGESKTEIAALRLTVVEIE